MQLSKRLQAVVDLVTKGGSIADIGCDHAYISIYLMEHKIAEKVVAMDVNKGPLERAKENIKKYQFEDSIEIRQSDGIKALKPGEVHKLLIAGMGGNLMCNILAGNPDVLAEVEELVLQPQSENREVRQYIEKLGFRIIEENMLIDEGKYYVMMKAKRTDSEGELKKEVFYRYGKDLLERKNLFLKQYLQKELEKLQEIKKCLQQHPSELNETRLKKVQEDITYCKEALTYYEM